MQASGPGTSNRVSFHCTRSAALSASLSRGRSDRRRSGSAAALASRWPQWRARRSTVVPSNRSELCSIQPSIPPLLDSSRRSDRSNCTAPGNVSAGRSARPGSASSGSGSLRSVNKTWNSGPRERSRSGCRASTSCSKGSSACARAPSAVSRPRRRRVRNVGSPDRSPRSTRRLRKRPITPSSAGSGRSATAVPTATSSCPAWRARTAWNTARTAMKRVAPVAPPRRRIASTAAASKRTGRRAPRGLRTGGRGRSVGSSRAGGRGVRRSRQ